MKSEKYKDYRDVHDYLTLLLDDYRKYGIPISDDEWNLLFNELDRCGNEYINSLQEEKT